MILFAFLLRGECSVWIKCSVPPEPANGNPAANSGTPPARGALQRQEGFRRCCHREATSLPGDHLPLSASDPPNSRGTKTSTYQESRILLRPSCTNSGEKLVGKKTLGINLIEMQFRDLLCVEPVHHGRGLAGLGNLRSQFMETEAFQVRHKWFWCSCMLMGRSEGVLTYKSITGKYIYNPSKIILQQ